MKTNLINKESFDKLTNSEKRVAICQDVIERLDLNYILPIHGHLFKNLSNFIENNIEITPREAFNSDSCEACAKGALVCSWVGNFNKFNYYDLKEVCRSSDLFIHVAPQGLAEIFGQEMLDNIEAAYEGQGYGWHYDRDKASKYASFFGKYPNPEYHTDRSEPKYIGDLREIMQNIVDNKGELVIV